MKNIHLYNIGVSEHSGINNFSASGSRGSTISDNGIKICTASLDDILNDKPVTFINMDIEGQEVSAIRGAKKTIINHRPKMLISCYHRSEDIIDIPLNVLRIRNDYRIYMRHLPSIPAWDTAYYFI